METTSLAIKQRNHFKDKHPDTIILMKMGDFYEAFDDDAVILHEVVGLTLTSRSGVKMAGLPYHSIEGYLEKLVQAGHRVALCEQVQKPTDKVIKRDIVRITKSSITPVA